MSGTPAVSVRRHTRDEFAFESRTVAGPGPGRTPVLLIGGAFQRKESWGRFEQHMLEQRPLITVDLPGWGAADTLPAAYGTDFLAAAARQVLDDLGVGRVDVCAGSYGAMIGYRLTQLHPGMVGHLALLATMTTVPDAVRAPVVESLRLLDEGRMDEFAAASVALYMCPDTDREVMRRSAITRILTRRFASLDRDEVVKHLHNTRRLLDHDHLFAEPTIRRPMLVATGEHDTFASPEISRAVARTSPEASFTLIADADHMAHLERPQEVVEMILAFFDDQPVVDLPYCRHTAR